MSFRHTMITQFVYNESQEDLNELIRVMKSHCDIVWPRYTDTGKLDHIAARSRDGNNYAVEEQELPAIVTEAKGVLKGDLDIVVAWECESEKPPRQRVWTIKGRGDKTAMQYLEEQS